MDIFIGVVVGLLVLMFLVTAHEFGHFIAARRNGVNVLEFGIGFPPRIAAWMKDPKTGKWRKLPRKEWSKDKVSKVVYSSADDKSFAQKGMVFSLNWLPIGGFCQMDGESAADSREGTFGKAGFWAKTKILFAGVTMNWLVAILIFTILAWTGMPEFLDNQFTIGADTRTDSTPVRIASVAEDSPAARAGLKAGDYILTVEGAEVRHASDVMGINESHAGEIVSYVIQRDIKTGCCLDDCPECTCVEDCKMEPAELSFDIHLNATGSEYLLGITMETSQALSYSTWSAPIVGVGLTAQITGETFKGVGIMLWNLISGVGSQFSPDEAVRENGQDAISSVGDSVSGPVGIIGVLFPAFTAAGPSNLAFLAALISVSLACMNVLPIPALDGGRWLLIAIYKLRKKKLTKETEEKIVSRAFMVLLALIFIVTILDIIRIAQ
ncbi:MAG: M50 family metallopeptidase [Candidatus Saccharimonadaceae bacterium]|nr:M50 family metallopeptidase [Candidatus Saccharimonadaceae bacterium]